MAIKVTNSRKKAVFSEINITPLTDIFLVLLIIMMVVAPMFQSNTGDINIPEINSGLTVEEKAATVSITKDGTYYLNGTPVELENLTQQLVEIKPTLKKAEVLVKADTAAKSRYITDVMRAAKEAEYEKLTVAGEPLSRKEQKNLENNKSRNVPAEVDNMPLSEETVQINVVNVSDENRANTDTDRPYADKPAVHKTHGQNTDWEE